MRPPQLLWHSTNGNNQCRDQFLPYHVSIAGIGDCAEVANWLVLWAYLVSRFHGKGVMQNVLTPQQKTLVRPNSYCMHVCVRRSGKCTLQSPKQVEWDNLPQELLLREWIKNGGQIESYLHCQIFFTWSLSLARMLTMIHLSKIYQIQFRKENIQHILMRGIAVSQSCAFPCYRYSLTIWNLNWTSAVQSGCNSGKWSLWLDETEPIMLKPIHLLPLWCYRQSCIVHTYNVSTTTKGKVK